MTTVSSGVRRWDVDVGGPWQGQPFGQPVADPGHAKQRDTRCRQLDAERQAVQPTTDVGCRPRRSRPTA
jgi:hypothetical protein